MPQALPTPPGGYSPDFGFGGMQGLTGQPPPGMGTGFPGGGFDPNAIAANPGGFQQWQDQARQREQMMPGSTMYGGGGGQPNPFDVNAGMQNVLGARGFGPRNLSAGESGTAFSGAGGPQVARTGFSPEQMAAGRAAGRIGFGMAQGKLPLQQQTTQPPPQGAL
jgi:hypothetical protein